MDLKYPLDATTDNDKLEFAYIAQETLRKEHNKKGQEYKDGKITFTEWKAWLSTYFEPRQAAIIRQVQHYKDSIKLSTKWEVDLESDINTSEVTP